MSKSHLKRVTRVMCFIQCFCPVIATSTTFETLVVIYDMIVNFELIKVSQDKAGYLSNIEEREEGGTPAIVESIRAGMAFQLKQVVTIFLSLVHHFLHRPPGYTTFYLRLPRVHHFLLAPRVHQYLLPPHFLLPRVHHFLFANPRYTTYHSPPPVHYFLIGCISACLYICVVLYVV